MPYQKSKSPTLHTFLTDMAKKICIAAWSPYQMFFDVYVYFLLDMAFTKFVLEDGQVREKLMSQPRMLTQKWFQAWPHFES